MVVKTSAGAAPRLDLGYLALFVGMRVNQLTIERLHRAGFTAARESHGYVIQHLIESERSITELAARMEVSQQAASKAVAELSALGVIEIAPGADRRRRQVRLSAKGWKLVNKGRTIRRGIERRLVGVVGLAGYETARALLAECLEAMGGMERVRSRRILPPQ